MPTSTLACRRIECFGYDEQNAPSCDGLQVQIFANGAELSGIVEMARKTFIKGFTLNPTLLRKAGIAEYGRFAREVLAVVPDRPRMFRDDAVKAGYHTESSRTAKL